MRRLIDHFFLSHPHAMGESYGQHLGVASRFGLTMIAGGLACITHGIFPRAFTTTGSQTVRALYSQMVSNRRRAPAPGADALYYEI